MKHSPVPAILGLLTAALSANPLAVDSARRPITMIAEKVTITVKPGVSVVTGNYTFRQCKDDMPQEKDTHALVFVPVLLPETAKGVTPPVVRVGNREGCNTSGRESERQVNQGADLE
jgi:hypothetical protein